MSETDESIFERYPIATRLVASGVMVGAAIGLGYCVGHYLNASYDNQCMYSTKSHGHCHNMNYQCSDDEINYTPLSPEVIDYIVKTGESVTEVCAGAGKNSELLRKEGVTVHAYDLKSIPGKVMYGVNGLVEANHTDDILMICSGFDCVTSINKFNGSTLIIGGVIENMYPDSYIENEFIQSLSKPIPVSLPLKRSQHIYKLHLRPSYKEILELGWKLDRVFMRPVKSIRWTHAHIFYIFKRADTLTTPSVNLQTEPSTSSNEHNDTNTLEHHEITLA